VTYRPYFTFRRPILIFQLPLISPCLKCKGLVPGESYPHEIIRRDVDGAEYGRMGLELGFRRPEVIVQPFEVG
jgi:hypothetical protein